MTDQTQPQVQPDPKPQPVPRVAEKVHEWPEIKPLIEKAGADRERRVPQGTMKTGGDTAGGGATKPLDLLPTTETKTPASPESKTD